MDESGVNGYQAYREEKAHERAVSRLVEANMGFVVTVAREYLGKGLPMDDLVSEGSIGLLKAARKFDDSRGVKFVSYAAPMVRQAIERAINQQGGLYQVPRDERGAAAQMGRRPMSVDAPLGHRTNMSLLSVLVNSDAPMADERVHSAAVEDAVVFALESLDDRERRVVDGVFGIGDEPATMAEIGEAMGLKRERVRQIRNKALRKLRKVFRGRLRELRK